MKKIRKDKSANGFFYIGQVRHLRTILLLLDLKAMVRTNLTKYFCDPLNSRPTLDEIMEVENYIDYIIYEIKIERAKRNKKGLSLF